MIFFVTVLRALAAAIITNSHYTGVYPTDLIANGGLYGDVIFFAVSGFCLVNIKEKFSSWYCKRLLRIFPIVIFISLIFCATGLFKLNFDNGVFNGIISMLVYPTKYHFVASIIVIYIPFYFIIRNEWLRNHISVVFCVTGLIWALIYVFIYDKSYYHIDTVREPMIRFLFFFAMLIGAYFRLNNEKFINKKTVLSWIAFPVLFAVYFASKLMFSRISSISYFQIVNQVILLVFLAVTFRCFASIDGKLEKLPKIIKNPISFISGITLEIYLVQIPLIQTLNVFPFPLNWVFITTVIILLAFVLSKISGIIQAGIVKICELKNKN